MTDFGWTAALVTRALGMPQAGWDHAYAGLCTDTRALQDGELFVALKGERFDAHDYLSDARLAGVGGVVVRKGTPRWPGFDWFEVDDTLVALGQLARLRRDAFQGPVVAVTGTTGKTATKELTAAALASRYAVHKSERNLNNLVGVPLTVLAAPLEAGTMVVECGASVKGEIPRMRQIVRPDVAVVTNVDAGHLEGFGDVAGVLEEKVALLEDAPLAVVGLRPAELADAARRVAKRVVTAGTQGPADWTAEHIVLRPDGRARFTVRGVAVELPFAGRHMVDNALLALAAGDAAGVSLADAAGALAQARLPGMRGEVFEADGMTVINDCYNANPSSVRAALDLLSALRRQRRAVVVLGTMRELGKRSTALHAEVAEAVMAAKPDLVAAIGAFAPALQALKKKHGAVELVTGQTPADVGPALRERLRPGDVVLLKASRGVALETIIPILWPTHAPSEAH